MHLVYTQNNHYNNRKLTQEDTIKLNKSNFHLPSHLKEQKLRLKGSNKYLNRKLSGVKLNNHLT